MVLFFFLTLVTNCLTFGKSNFHYEPQSLYLENDASKTVEYFHMGFNNGNKVVSIG